MGESRRRDIDATMGCCASASMTPDVCNPRVLFKVWKVHQDKGHPAVVEAINKVEKQLSSQIASNTTGLIGCTSAKQASSHEMHILMAVFFESEKDFIDEQERWEQATDQLKSKDGLHASLELDIVAACELCTDKPALQIESIVRGNPLRLVQYDVKETDRDQTKEEFGNYMSLYGSDCKSAHESGTATGYVVATNASNAHSFVALMGFRDDASRESFASMRDLNKKSDKQDSPQKKIMVKGKAIEIQNKQTRKEMVRDCACKQFESKPGINIECVIKKTGAVSSSTPWFKGKPTGNHIGLNQAQDEDPPQESPQFSPSSAQVEAVLPDSTNAWFKKEKLSLSSQDLTVNIEE